MFDSNEETCWNSDQGESQWVALEFPQPVKVSELRLQFQGGFPIQDAPSVQRLKIVFENSADFFGRIIVYTLDILGEKIS
ncbi:Nuclear receptor 2C2-associated protein [Labeo rohita]|uniref:Nuclear receptor 2C2-associated protein n=1 Tax=Labeo rohita TaxID=84645 RepID=A0ABQ8LIA2_LABRO|nr:Nuclear receptor 2C2-associated protein [Labeo rohita]